MKNILSRFGKISLLLAFMYFVVGCDDDKEDVAPGLYVMSDEIETFPGDTVLVSGTASNYVGLESVTLSCEQWGIHINWAGKSLKSLIIIINSLCRKTLVLKNIY